MKITTRTLNIAILGVAGALLPSLAHAQFGFSIVDSPAQDAHAATQIFNEGKSLGNQAEQLAQGSQRNLTLAAQLKNDLAMAATALRTYNTTMNLYTTTTNNLRYFNTKSVWNTARNGLVALSVQNQHGETAGLQSTLSGTPGTASTAWKIMNIALAATSTSFWNQQVAGNSQRLTALAHIEAMDAISTQCLGAVAAYNKQRTSAQPGTTALQATQYSTSAQTNTEMEQLNLLNMSDAQTMNESQGQGQLQSCLAAQAAVSNMQQRSAEAQALNDASFAQQQQAMNPTYAANESKTWETYLP